VPSDTPTALVVGSDSLIGGALMAHLRRTGLAVLGTTRRPERVDGDHLRLDLAEGAESWRCDRPVGAAVICAGVTKLAACQSDPARTAAVNVRGVSAVIRTLAAAGAFAVYLSTNQVFDGSAPRRRPDEPVSPVSEYGRQKAEVERTVLSLGEQGCVVRLTKVLTPGAPLLRGWLDALRRGEAIRPFSDVVMAPVPLSFVIEVLARVLRTRAPGVVQVSGDRDVSYAEAAAHIAGRIGASADLLRPTSSEAAGVPRQAAPRHTTLDTSRLERELGLRLPGVRAALDEAVGL
jgi:dTDP-4-dehydrorhamnose reductase